MVRILPKYRERTRDFWGGLNCTFCQGQMLNLRPEDILRTFRAAFAVKMDCSMKSLQLLHPDGCILQNGPEGDLKLKDLIMATDGPMS